jgi:hypothetical protein
MKDSSSSDDLQRKLPLLRAASAGHLHSLECPSCGGRTVGVWFTHPRTTQYLVWFVCSDCTFYLRVQSSLPPFYSEERRSPEFEYYDHRILNGMEDGVDPEAVDALKAALDAARKSPDPR